MKSAEFTWTSATGWQGLPEADFSADLILYFGSRPILAGGECFRFLKERFPNAVVVGTSGGGQIHSAGILDEGITGIALTFEHSTIKLAKAVINTSNTSHETGRILGAALKSDDLAGVLVLSEGLKINGDQLIEGLSSSVSPGVTVCGGMAADDGRFERTLLFANDLPMRGAVAAIGFYGPNVRIGFGHGGGWCPIGEEMKISFSRDNDLYDLDGRTALEIYDAHLGDKADQLPLSGLKFPLSIQDPEHQQTPLVRTLLSVDREVGIMTFAGNVPENWKARMMTASSDDLVSAAAEAAEMSHIQAARHSGPNDSGSASVLISCIGRRLILDSEAKREVAAARNKLGADTAMAGFYSYGEFCTTRPGSPARLLNQSFVVLSVREDMPKPLFA